MKFLITAVVALAANFAMAHGEVTIRWPSINGLAINNACATDSTLQSLTPVRYCSETKVTRYAVRHQGEAEIRRLLKDGEEPRAGEWLETESTCTAYATKDMEVSRTVTVSTCIRWTHGNEEQGPQCLEYNTHSELSGLTYSVEKIVDYGEAQQDTWFNFTIPSCN